MTSSDPVYMELTENQKSQSGPVSIKVIENDRPKLITFSIYHYLTDEVIFILKIVGICLSVLTFLRLARIMYRRKQM